MKNIYKFRLIVSFFIFIFTCLAITGFFYPIHFLNIQFIPLILRLIVDISIEAIVLLLLFIVLTLLFGRLYCSLFCPLGLIQELTTYTFQNRLKTIKIKKHHFKYILLAIILGSVFAYNFVFIKYFSPYAIFSSFLSLSIDGIMLTCFILILTFLKGRYFCINICPVGTILSLISKISIFKLYINNESCSKCGKCLSFCQNKCIDYENSKIDNENCIKCLKCISQCPNQAIKYGIKPKKKAKFNIRRREFLLFSVCSVILLGTYKISIDYLNTIKTKISAILPPGAKSSNIFSKKCINCNLCVQNCPNKIIAKATKDIPFAHIDYTKGYKYCEDECNICSNICPVNALNSINKNEKSRTQIAIAKINIDKCAKCFACFRICPTNAISEINDKIMIDGNRCIGCGKCKTVCYNHAININPVDEQKLI